MNCPDCNHEMEQGFLQRSGVMVWTKRIHKVTLLPNEGEVLLMPGFLKPEEIPAFICKNCELIVVDYSATQVWEK